MSVRHRQRGKECKLKWDTKEELCNINRKGIFVQIFHFFPSCCQVLYTLIISVYNYSVCWDLRLFKTQITHTVTTYSQREASPWLWEKMSVAGFCSPSERRGGRVHSNRESSWGRVLMLKVNAWFTKADLISSIWRAAAGLPFSNRISSPAFKPGRKKRRHKTRLVWVSH